MRWCVGGPWKFFSLAVGLILSVSCTRESSKPSTVKLKLPSTGSAFASKTLSALTASDWGVADPSAFAEISCFAVFITAPDLNGGKCVDSSDAEVFSVGLIAGLFPAGSEVTLDVPSGNARTIRLIGVKASSSAACATSASNLSYENFSAPFVLGSTTTDLSPGVVTISISASLVASGKFHSCSGSPGLFGPTPPALPAAVAVLSSTPGSVSNAANLNVVVGGTGVLTYKYKLGPAGTTFCSDAAGYSAPLAVATPITNSIGGFSDGPLRLCVLGGNSSGTYQTLASATSYSWTKDTGVPTATISSPTAGSFINSTSVASFPVSGTCSETSQSVVITGDASATTTCSSGTWSANLDFSSASDGTVTISVTHSDLAGNTSTPASRNFVKDTVGPSTPTLIIDSGAGSTTSTSVTLSLGATGATHMYITNTAGCATGGTWETFTSIKSWTLAGTNSVQTVYVKYKDGAANGSSCISDTITHTTVATADHLTWSVQPVNSAAGSHLLFTIEVRDISNNVVATGADSTATITVSVYNGPGGATLNGTAAVSAVNGVATWTGSQGLFLDLVGSYILRASDGTRTADSTPFLISHGAADHLTWSVQPSNTLVGNPLTATVEVRDMFENLVSTGASSTATITLSKYTGPGSSLTGTTSRAAVGGVATWSTPEALTLNLAGSYILQASDGVRTQNSSSFEMTPHPLNFLALGNEHTCGKNTLGNGSCWGRGLESQLGNGSTADSFTPTPISGGITWVNMESFTRTVCGVDTGNFGYCWGANSSGQVGDNTATDRSIPTQLSGSWMKITVGNMHSCGLTPGNAIHCWGNNTNGEVGDGTSTNRSIPVLVDSGTSYMDIDAGSSSTCGVTTTGVVRCWGSNTYGQLGNNSTTASSTPVMASLATGNYSHVSVGGSHVCALASGGVIHCWGAGTSGQLGNATLSDHWNTLASVSGSGWTKVVTGSDHTCGFKSGTSEVFCWGLNSSGQLGLGHTTNVNIPTLVGTGFTDVFAGYSHTCGLKAGGALWCWGNGSNGQLGNGTTAGSTSPILVTP
ncbi:MAG: hypothetical protein AB7G93_06295 [Bdellovibrionales bacterium]